MKINFRNKTARLKNLFEDYSCRKCPFHDSRVRCPWTTSTIVDCYSKGWWVDGESLDIFKV
jgi:hypothetical protein